MLGYFVVFKGMQFQVRKEIKRQIKFSVPEDKLVVLRITKAIEFGNSNEFKRIHKGEFRYKGQMYDIIRTEISGDTTIYTCIHDVKESNLFANLDKYIKEDFEKNNSTKQKANKLNSQINNLFFQITKQQKIILFYKNLFFNEKDNLYCFSYLYPLNKPPTA